MSEPRDDFSRLLKEWAESPDDEGAVLDYETLSAYREGRLSEDERERVREHLIRSPESTERLLWLAGEELPADDGEHFEPSGRAGWPHLSERLGLQSRSTSGRRWGWQAAAVLLVGVGLGWVMGSGVMRQRVVELEERLRSLEAPSAMVADLGTPLLHPLPITRGDGSAGVEVPESARLFVLLLDTPVTVDRTASWQVEICEQDDNVVWKSQGKPNDLGQLVLTFSRDLLTGDRYRLRARPVTGDGRMSSEVAVEVELYL